MTGHRSTPQIALAANNGDIGGGEVMLLSIATALEALGIEVTVLGPEEPAALVDAARARGFSTLALPGRSRRRYMAALAWWRLRNLGVPLWCNGMVPSLATAGLGPRIVHLHMLPLGGHRAALRIARCRAARVLVPSRTVAAQVQGSEVLANWTEEIAFTAGRRETPVVAGRREGARPVRIGFLGRITRDKGVDVLARAMSTVAAAHEVRLVLAGQSRFSRPGEDEAVDSALAGIRGITETPGWIERDEFFAKVDLAAFPSTAPESFGLVVAEAMAAGVPFVISDAGALPEVAGTAHPWVARAGDAEDLARVIERALEDTARGDAHRARSARERWEREHSPRAGTARVAVLLQELPRSRGMRREERAR